MDGTRLTSAQRTELWRLGIVTALLSFLALYLETQAYIIYFHYARSAGLTAQQTSPEGAAYHLLAYVTAVVVVSYVLAKTFDSWKYLIGAGIALLLLVAVYLHAWFFHGFFFQLLRALAMLASIGALLANIFVALFQMFRSKLLLTARGEYLERKIAEYEVATRELQTSEQKYRALVEAFPHPVILMDQGVVTYANPAADTQFQCAAPGDLLGRSWADALSTSDQERIRTFATDDEKDAVAALESFQTTMRRLDGSEFPGLVCARNITYADKSFIQAVIVDMTQYEESQRAIRESEQRLRTVLEATSDGVYDKDILTGHVFHSPAWSQMLGFEPSEIQDSDEPWERLVHPEDLARVKAAAKADLARGAENINAEFRMLTKTGSWKWVLSRARVVAHDEDGNPLRMIGTHTDITGLKLAEESLRRAYAEVEARVEDRTASLREANRRLEAEIIERQRAEQALRESERHYRNLIDGLSDAVYLVTIPKGVYTYVSPSAQHVLGFSPEELMASPELLRHALHPDFRDAYENIWRDLVGGLAAPTAFEYRLVDRNGNERWVRESVRIVRNAEGLPVAAEGIARNVTEERRAQQTVSELRTTVMESARLSMLGEISANVAHEINNPLAVISGSAEQITSAIDRPEPVRPEIIKRLADALMRNTTRIREMIKGLRNLSRDATNDPFMESPLKSILDDSIALCEERFAFHSVALHRASVPETLTLECRPTQILEVLVNLLNNALHAVTSLPERWVSVAVEEQERYIEISVTDSGHGISQESLSHIFDTFVTTKPGGTGLGLSICRRILTGHAGSVHVDTNCPNTRFVVRLPRTQS